MKARNRLYNSRKQARQKEQSKERDKNEKKERKETFAEENRDICYGDKIEIERIKQKRKE